MGPSVGELSVNIAVYMQWMSALVGLNNPAPHDRGCFRQVVALSKVHRPGEAGCCRQVAALYSDQ